MQGKINVPRQVNMVLKALEGHGYEAFIVGGCVRDAIMGIEPKDYDVTTSALPEETKEIFRDFHVIETGIKHGTVTVMVDKEPIEITTYRIDENYVDNRHPENVRFTRSLKEDMARRDFTMNAIAYNPACGLVDYYGGVEDIQRGVIRAVGEADKRFEEDALRIMRALRFSAVTGFIIEENTAEAALRHKDFLNNISAERIQVELVKLLCGKDARRVLMDYTDILAVILPELLEMKGFDQCNAYHIYDVLEHTAVAVANTPAEPVLRLSALLHDTGKPETFFQDCTGVGHFYGHNLASKRIAEDLLERLKFDNDTKEKVLLLVEKHDMQIKAEETAVKRALNKLGEENFRNLIALARADNKAQNPIIVKRQEHFDKLLAIAEEIILKEECFSLKALAVNGRDLMEIGFKPGPELGKALENLLEAVISGEIENKKEELLKKAIDFSII